MLKEKYKIKTLRHCRLFSCTAGVVASVSGALVFLGWVFDFDGFRAILPGTVSMVPNTAICVVLAGIALSILSVETDESKSKYKRVAFLIAGMVVLVASDTLLEYLFKVNFGIDNLLFRRMVESDSANHGRMAEATAVGFTLLSISLMLLDKRGRWTIVLRDSMALSACALGLVAVLGYVYGVQALYNFAFYSSMALHTSLLLVILALGIIVSRPERGAISILTNQHSGALMARSILPLAVLTPIVVGWLIMKAERLGLYEGALGVAFFTTATISTFVLLVWLTAR